MEDARVGRASRRPRGARPDARGTERYRGLRNPFEPQRAFSDDAVAAMHGTALDALETLGVRILLDEARDLFRAAGARVDEQALTVRIGREVVEAALATAPRSVRLRAADPAREQAFEPGAMLFAPGSGCPNAFDRERGRRPGSLRDFEETLRLQQSFDVIHVLGPSAEPQDVPVHLRHYAMMRAQMEISDKPLFVYARGRAQVAESFEMIRLGRGLDEAAFEDGVWATTIINSNSPRQLDVPMARGLIDFARAGQMSIVTPFCLMGAMAPVTVAGALTLQHAEALAGIALAQLARPGAPVAYGGFASNVDMRSGAPAFGTPEHVLACLGSGQLARLIGLPWRSASGSSSKAADGQGAQETTMALWGAVLAGATVTLHSAGWLEGGLTFGYEKFVLDVEGLQTIAELCAPPEADAGVLAALAEVAPGGHFFGTRHTLDRYASAFYRPLVADLSNHGTWAEAGSRTADVRATAIWKERLATFQAPAACDGAAERLAPYVERRKDAGGARPED